METIRPNNTDPVPVRRPTPRMGTIILRFVALLVIAVAVLTWGWSR